MYARQQHDRSKYCHKQCRFHIQIVYSSIYSVGCVIIINIIMIIIFFFFSLQLNESVRKLFHLLTCSYVTCWAALTHSRVLPSMNRINLSKRTHFPTICRKNLSVKSIKLLFLLLQLIFFSRHFRSHTSFVDRSIFISVCVQVQGFCIFPVQLRAHEISIWAQFISKWHIVIVDCTSTVSKQTRLFLIKQPIFSFCYEKMQLSSKQHTSFLLVLSLFSFYSSWSIHAIK